MAVPSLLFLKGKCSVLCGSSFLLTVNFLRSDFASMVDVTKEPLKLIVPIGCLLVENYMFIGIKRMNLPDVCKKRRCSGATKY